MSGDNCFRSNQRLPGASYIAIRHGEQSPPRIGESLLRHVLIVYRSGFLSPYRARSSFACVDLRSQRTLTHINRARWFLHISVICRCMYECPAYQSITLSLLKGKKKWQKILHTINTAWLDRIGILSWITNLICGSLSYAYASLCILLHSELQNGSKRYANDTPFPLYSFMPSTFYLLLVAFHSFQIIKRSSYISFSDARKYEIDRFVINIHQLFFQQ